MPCRDDYPTSSNEDAGLRASADRSARAACEMRTVLWQHNLQSHLTPETRQWIADHDKADADREAAENLERLHRQMRRDALAKLSPMERKLLGI